MIIPNNGCFWQLSQKKKLAQLLILMFHINESAGNHIPVLFRQTIVINQLILLTQTKKNKRLKG